MVIRVAGDGKQYKAMLSDGRGGGPFAKSPTFMHDILTKEGKEEEVALCLSDFKPSYGPRPGSAGTKLVASEMVDAGFALSLIDSKCNPNPTFNQGEFDFSLRIKAMEFKKRNG